MKGRKGDAQRGLPARQVREALEQVFASPDFDGSRRSREFLRFIVEEALAGRAEAITQTTIATRVFGRKDDFDAVVDPIVRIQAGRLRRSLERYYLLSGRQDPLRIELPKGGYVTLFRAATATETAARDESPTRQAPLDDWPTVVLVPFQTVSGGPELEAFAERLGDVLSGEMAGYRNVHLMQRRHAGLEPLARDNGRFALTGRLHREGDGAWISASLVDRSTASQVWGDQYRTGTESRRHSIRLDDVARMIAARVGSEEGVIVRLLADERRKRTNREPTSYDAVLRAYDFFFRRDPDDFLPAVEALRDSVRVDPSCALAWSLLARLCVANHAFEAIPPTTSIDEAIGLAQTGVRLDPTSRIARCTLAAALLVKGDVAAAREQVEQALALSSGSFVYLEMIGWLLTLCGEWVVGAGLLRIVEERNPCRLPHASIGLWAAHLHAGDIEEAYGAAVGFRDPTFFWRALMRACCLGHLGRPAEARAEVAELLRRKPDFKARGHILIGHFIKSPELKDRIVEGLAKAGLHLDRERVAQLVS